MKWSIIIRLSVYLGDSRSCAAHMHSRFTAILPSPLGSSNDVQRSVWGFNTSEYQVMLSDYLTFKSLSCYFCNTQIIAVSYLRSKNKILSILVINFHIPKTC